MGCLCVAGEAFNGFDMVRFRGLMRDTEPIDSRKASRYATSEANKRATAKKSLGNHCNL